MPAPSAQTSTSNRCNYPELHNVSQVRYRASGAQTIPRTTVAGGGPVPLLITAEGTTTLTVEAVGGVGNESECLSRKLHLTALESYGCVQR